MNNNPLFTSFADISFILIFFLIISISSTPGETLNNKENKNKGLVIKIIDENIYIENKRLEIEKVNKIISDYKEKDITIEANSKTSFKSINRVIEIIKKYKIDNIIFEYRE